VCGKDGTQRRPSTAARPGGTARGKQQEADYQYSEEAKQKRNGSGKHRRKQAGREEKKERKKGQKR
jgi:hypothetical protein